VFPASAERSRQPAALSRSWKLRAFGETKGQGVTCLCRAFSTADRSKPFLHEPSTRKRGKALLASVERSRQSIAPIIFLAKPPTRQGGRVLPASVERSRQSAAHLAFEFREVRAPRRHTRARVRRRAETVRPPPGHAP